MLIKVHLMNISSAEFFFKERKPVLAFAYKIYCFLKSFIPWKDLFVVLLQDMSRVYFSFSPSSIFCLHPGVCATCRTISSPLVCLPQVGIYERSGCKSFGQNCTKRYEGTIQIAVWHKLASHTLPAKIHWFFDVAKLQAHQRSQAVGSGLLWRGSIRRKQSAW